MALAIEPHRPDRRNRRLSSVSSKRRSKVTPISPEYRASISSRADSEGLARTSRASLTSLEKQTPSNSTEQVVTFQKTIAPQPVWLQWLNVLQRSSSVLGFCLVAATLVVYGSTVYSQQRWDTASNRLDKLRRDERQLLEKMESLKQQVAEQTETSQTGLVVPQPENFLFLKPAMLRPARATHSPPPNSGPSAPMGY